MMHTDNLIDLAEKRREKMSNAIAKVDINDISAIEKVLFNGDLKELSPEQRVTYVNHVCNSLGLNPATQPFSYMNLSGKLVLYARKDCTEQLRKIYSVSIRKLTKEVIEGIYTVSALAELPNGRSDESTGCVSIQGLRGDALANAYMKAETKAKRRVTLSICGLGILDESEMESIAGATTDLNAKPQSHGQQKRQYATNMAISAVEHATVTEPVFTERDAFRADFRTVSKDFMMKNPGINMKELLMERYGVLESKDLDDNNMHELFDYMVQSNKNKGNKDHVLDLLKVSESTVTLDKPNPNAVKKDELPWTKHLK